MACASDAAVLGFLQDTLDAEQRSSFERHLDECAECLELVTLAARSSLAARDPEDDRPPEPSPGAVSPGTLIGRYEIVEPLGRGAMGMVYAARDTRLGRRVAIKLVHPVRARERRSQLGLLREAQALARITQPNVLTVYDMGTFGESVFLAAELVEGDTLDVWLARPRRWRQIVEVFLQAARGLEAAHAVDVVHRDFKPSNAMVGRDGRVRVFDFGVARFADARSAGRELAGTPLYMSPEQLRGDIADARSDQYALCVALHEALFGEHPVLRTQAGAPPRASQVIGRPAAWLKDILRRGLAHEADQRFASLAELRRAVERGLGRRGRWLVAGMGAVAVSAAGVTAVLGYARGTQAPLARCPEPSLDAWSAARKADVARALRATEVAYAPAVAARVERVLDQFTTHWRQQERAACFASTVTDGDDGALHGRRAACLDRDRLVFEAIVERFAAADRTLVEHADRLLGALPDLALCAHTDAPAWPTDPAARARITHHFEEVTRIGCLAEGGQLDAAARDASVLVREASALHLRRAEVDATYLAGHIAGLRGELAEGVRQVEQALWAAESTGYDELVAIAASELLWLIGSRQRRPADARQFVELARAAADRVGSVPARARAARAIGNLEIIAANFDAADATLTSALALNRAAAPSDPVLGAKILMDLANLDAHRGQHASSETRLRQARTAIVAELGELHPSHAQVLNNLGNTLLDLERPDEAAGMFDQAIAILERALAPDHPDIAQTLLNAAGVHIARGDNDRARALLERSIAILERVDRLHPLLAAALNNLAEVRRLQGARQDAEALHRRALAIRRERLGDRHPEVTQSLLSLAAIVLERGDVPGAAALCADAVRSGSADPAVQGEIEICRGEVERAAGRSARAVELFEHALELGRAAEDVGRLADAQFALARALPASARPRAVALARAARTGYEAGRAYRKQELAEVDAWLAAHAGDRR